MLQQLDLAWNAGMLVHAAALLQVFGFLNRNQLVLRGLVLAGSLVYTAYYYLFPEVPLWGAMFWSTGLAAANLIGIVRVILDRRRSSGVDDDDCFLDMLKVLTPGEFRRLMQMAEWHTTTKPTQLTVEGEPVPSLYFVIDGKVDIEKSGRTFTLPPGLFIGEVSFLLGGAASASVSVQAGAKFIEWPKAALHKAIDRTPSLGASMERLFNQELARKVAISWS